MDTSNKTPTGIAPDDSLIEYPSDFPIKVMGKMQDHFAEAIVEVVRQFDPEFHAGRM